ncbi:MAG TPA: hypothetical protein PLK85_02465 [Alphaproteobacteria bacterium]|nr:hypothetical protein [Alphaproteobacteria bacterium]
MSGIYFYALPKAEQKILDGLASLGINNAKIEGTSIHLTGLKIDKIILDQDGFDEIKNLNANIYWPDFIRTKNIDKIVIEESSLSMTAPELRQSFIKLGKFDWSTLTRLSVDALIIHNVTLNLSASTKALRFTGNFKLRKQNDFSVFSSQIKAAQYDLGFKSQWQGKVTKNNDSVTLEALFEEVKANNKLIEMNRGDGWLSYIRKNNTSEISGQVEAGSGKIFKVPAKNISLVLGHENEGYPILFRAEAAGNEGTILTADYMYAHDVQKRDFKAALKIGNLENFLQTLKQENLIAEETSLPQLDTLETNVKFVPEKRFSGGPIPFDVVAQNGLNGTFLIYPDSFDVRGSLETEPDFLKFVKNLFPIPDENIVDDVIRIDGNLESLISSH